MKKQLLLFIYCVAVCCLQAQVPYIGASTVIPQNPGPGAFVKIVTNVTTPNQGGIVHTSVTVSGTNIYLEGCYWQGMATALQTFIDTFMVGQLPAGNYQVHQTAYLSSTQQHCTPTNTNTATFTLQAGSSGTTTGLPGQQYSLSQGVYPNPSSGVLHLPAGTRGEVAVFSAGGILVRRSAVLPNATLDVSGLANGLYFINYSTTTGTVSTRFVKTSSE